MKQWARIWSTTSPRRCLAKRESRWLNDANNPKGLSDSCWRIWPMAKRCGWQLVTRTLCWRGSFGWLRSAENRLIGRVVLPRPYCMANKQNYMKSLNDSSSGNTCWKWQYQQVFSVLEHLMTLILKRIPAHSIHALMGKEAGAGGSINIIKNACLYLSKRDFPVFPYSRVKIVCILPKESAGILFRGTWVKLVLCGKITCGWAISTPKHVYRSGYRRNVYREK